MLPKRYIDSRLHIVQADGDGGDSLNRLGCYFSCAGMSGLSVADMVQYTKAMSFNELDGRYCRNPSPGKWYSNYNNTTRDQMITLEAAWAILGSAGRARRHFRQRIKRALFHFSSEDNGYDSGQPLKRKLPDAPTFGELATIIRAGRYGALRPLLHLLDFAILLDVSFFRRGHDSDNQLLPVVLAALKVYPSIWAGLIKRRYAKTDAITKLMDYHSEEPGHNGIGPLGVIMAATFFKEIA